MRATQSEANGKDCRNESIEGKQKRNACSCVKGFMRKLKFVAIGFVATLMACIAAEPKKAEVIHDLKIGDSAPNFSLPGIDGKTHTLAEYKNARLLMIAF